MNQKALVDRYVDREGLRGVLFDAHIFAKLALLFAVLFSFASSSWLELGTFVAVSLALGIASETRLSEYRLAYALFFGALLVSLILTATVESYWTSTVGNLSRLALAGASVGLAALSLKNLTGVRQIAGALRCFQSRIPRTIGGSLASAYHDYSRIESTSRRLGELRIIKRNSQDRLVAWSRNLSLSIQAALMNSLNDRFSREAILLAKGFESTTFASCEQPSSRTTNLLLVLLSATLVIITLKS